VTATFGHSRAAVIRSYDHADFPRELLVERKTGPVTVILPAREVADTVGSIVERVLALDGLVDQVLVVDAASEDGSADAAAAAGAEVHQQCELAPEFGPVLGKGDAMWRALAVVRGETVLYLDADTRDFGAQFVTGLLGPLLVRDGVRFVKASYRRPFASGGVELPSDGGRVSQLTARPLLSAFYPDLASLVQPLAGEVAAPLEVFERVPFSTGYAVETAMLLDLREQIGAAALAQVDVGERRNDHQPLDALRPMAETVLAVVCDRLRREGRLLDGAEAVGVVERPPFAARAPV
jgi:glucosyl-3-phosphoglycerate synthase